MTSQLNGIVPFSPCCRPVHFDFADPMGKFEAKTAFKPSIPSTCRLPNTTMTPSHDCVQMHMHMNVQIWSLSVTVPENIQYGRTNWIEPFLPKTWMVADGSVNTTCTPGSTVSVTDDLTSTWPEMTTGLWKNVHVVSICMGKAKNFG